MSFWSVTATQKSTKWRLVLKNMRLSDEHAESRFCSLSWQSHVFGTGSNIKSHKRETDTVIKSHVRPNSILFYSPKTLKQTMKREKKKQLIDWKKRLWVFKKRFYWKNGFSSGNKIRPESSCYKKNVRKFWIHDGCVFQKQINNIVFKDFRFFQGI